MPETLTTPQTTSTSIRETPPKLNLRVRRKEAQTIYLVRTLSDERIVKCRSGARYARKGDLLIVEQNGAHIDVVAPEALHEFYTPLDDDDLTLSGDQVTRCAKVLPVGSTLDPERFTQAIESRITLAGVELEFTPGQRAELQHRAEKRGWTVDKYVQYLLDRFTQDMWTIG